MSILFLILYIVLVLGLVIMLILDNRNPVKTMAWTVVLIFLPVVGMVFYYFFGRSTRRMRLISRKSADQLTRKSKVGCVTPPSSELPPEHLPLIRLFKKLNGAQLYDGNHVDIFTDGYSMIHSLLRDIREAKHHIHLEFYIFEEDPIGCVVRDMLIEKARQGVEVRLLFDDVGCWNVPTRFYDVMRAEGIEARGFLKVRFPLFTSRVNFRNHRKISIIDGHIGYIGGMNIAERYVKPKKFAVWRDTHLRMEGKAVYGLQSNFLMDWYFITGSLITASKYYPEIPDVGSALVQTVTSEPMGAWKPIMQGLLLAISSAKHYFYIQSPYFLPTEQIISALQTAALAGVDVRLMIPERSDGRFLRLASCSYVEEMLAAGVKVYFYRKGFLHSKLMVSDDSLSTVGSTNMDFRSFEHNFEINSFIYDRALALRMKEIFLRDQQEARLLNEKEWARRSRKQQVKESIVRLLSPLL
jgi:cardiolipin synthase